MRAEAAAEQVDPRAANLIILPQRLERECRTYARYLIGWEPNAYVIGKYIECHRIGRIVEPAAPFDRFLTGISARSPFLARLSDAYASRFLKCGALRKKLVLMLALLECAGATFATLDEVDGGGKTGTLIRLGWRVVVFAGALGISLLLFLPVHATLGLFARSGER